MAGISKKTIKNKNGKTTTKYTITYRDVFGKQHTSGLYDTIKEAKKDLGKFENINPNIKNITYGMIFSTFFAKVEKKYAKNTIRNYTSVYIRFLRKIDDIKYEKIDSIQWQSFFYDVEKKYGPHCAHTCFKFINATLNYSMKLGLININILNKVEKPKLSNVDTNHLTILEIKKILEKCKCIYPQYYVLLYTLIGTGARIGEVLALTKEDFNYKDKTIRINKQFTSNELKYSPKTESSKRNIYIFDDLADLLFKHTNKMKDSDLLFPNSRGNFINPSNLRNRFWKPLLNSCEIKKRVRIHDLRGSYIDMNQANGIPIKFTQSNVGHSNSSITIDIYNKNTPDMINLAQTTLNNIFEKCENNVRINENPSSKKIIHFPQKRLGTGF